MRPLWSGSIGFGLVNIPVKLYSATISDHGLNLDMLHKSDLSPIRFARICKADNKEIAWKDIVKGYELQDGKYVVLTDEDFQRADKAKASVIEIEEFVQEKEIDSIYFDKPYYLAPSKGAGHAFNLLRQVLEKAKKVGVARFVFRNREHLVIVKAHKNVLVLNQLRFDEEIRSAEDLEVPKEEKVTARELELAVALVDQLTHKFTSKQYKDTYTHQLKEIIQKKAKGKLPKQSKAAVAKPTKIVDLFATLKASLKPTKTTRGKSRKSA